MANSGYKDICFNANTGAVKAVNDIIKYVWIVVDNSSIFFANIPRFHLVTLINNTTNIDNSVLKIYLQQTWDEEYKSDRN